MYQHLEQLRRAPDHHKTRVALIGAGAITAMIFVSWLSVILPSNTSAIVADEQSQSTPVDQDGNTPLDALKKSTAQVFDAAKGLLQNTASQINLEDSYNKMKTQAQTGQINLSPETTSNNQ